MATSTSHSQSISESDPVSWTADSVREAVRKGQVKLKENSDGKAACWQQRLLKDSEVHLVVEAGVAFAVVSNQGFRNFAQQMISIGSKHGNINIDDALYGHTRCNKQYLIRYVFVKT